MAWFRRRRDPPAAAGPVPATPAVHPAFGDPEATRLRAAVVGADWPAVRDFFAGVTDPDDHSFYVTVASEVEGAEAWLTRVEAVEPDSALALLLAGAREVQWAWEARTGARARYVSREQFAVFFERLKIAESHLFEALHRDPDVTPAWGELIRVATGRQLGTAEARRRLDQVLIRHPGHVSAHGRMLQQLCRKWSGSHDAMHEFARGSMMKAPPGSPLGYLVATAHLEHWLDLDGDERGGYITAERVRAELHEAADRSVRHPAYQRRPGWPTVHNMFAMAFSLAGEHRAAAEQFHVLGDLVTRFPWMYLHGTDPGAPFLARREAAYQALGEPPTRARLRA